MDAQGIKAKHTRQTIFHQILSVVCDEIMFFSKYNTNLFIKKWYKSLAKIKYNGDQSDKDQYRLNYSQRSKLSLSDQWEISQSFQYCWAQFFLSVWNSSHDQRLSGAYKTSVKLLLHILGDDWKMAMHNDSWQRLFESVMECAGSWRKYKMKMTVPEWIVKSTLTINNILSIAIEYYPPVRDRIDKCAWPSLELAVYAFFFLHWECALQFLNITGLHKYIVVVNI